MTPMVESIGGGEWQEVEPKPNLYRLIALAAYAAYDNSMVGQPAPKVADYHARVRKPREGDLVVETTTLFRSGWRTGALGKLLRIAEEPIITREEWERATAAGEDNWADDFDDVPTERVWYIEPLDPDAPNPVRWTDASFIVVPAEGIMRWWQS